MFTNYSWITHQLAVGGLVAAPTEHPFDAVLSVQTWCPLAMAGAAAGGLVEYEWIPVLDRAAYAPTEAARVFDRIATRLDAWLRAGKRVLVHCHSGVSRSPAAVIWYLMHASALSWDAACADVKARHRPSTPDVRLEIPLRLAHGDPLTTTWVALHVAEFCRRHRTPGHPLDPQAVWTQLARAGALPIAGERPSPAAETISVPVPVALARWPALPFLLAAEALA